MNKNEIQTKYLAIHDSLGSREDAEDKELFDQQHRQVWIDCDNELKTRKVELEGIVSPTLEETAELLELEEMFPDITMTIDRLPRSQHLAIIKSIDVSKAKPIIVTRTLAGQDFDISCVVTQDVKDQYVEGKIAIGDIVIVAYCEERYEQAIVQSKVFKSW